MMTYDPAIHHRRSVRLQGYDYSLPGAYFVTIVAQGRACLFGVVADGEMLLNHAGKAVAAVWRGLPAHYPGLEIDTFTVMPNHVHGIIVLTRLVGAGLKPAPTKGYPLTEIVRGFKTFSARRVNEVRGGSGPVWQRGYYDHVIRRGESLDRVRRYIVENPARWAFDPENPDAGRPKPKNARGARVSDFAGGGSAENSPGLNR